MELFRGDGLEVRHKADLHPRDGRPIRRSNGCCAKQMQPPRSPTTAIAGRGGGGSARSIRAGLDRRPDRWHGELRPRRCRCGRRSIALQVDGEGVVGVVNAPALGERYVAVARRGRDAERQTPIRVSDDGRDPRCPRARPESSTEPARRALFRCDAGLMADCWRPRGFGDFWAHYCWSRGLRRGDAGATAGDLGSTPHPRSSSKKRAGGAPTFEGGPLRTRAERARDERARARRGPCATGRSVRRVTAGPLAPASGATFGEHPRSRRRHPARLTPVRSITRQLIVVRSPGPPFRHRSVPISTARSACSGACWSSASRRHCSARVDYERGQRAGAARDRAPASRHRRIRWPSRGRPGARRRP